MRFSRFGVFALISITVLIGANCSYYNRVISRKNLVDGAKAYKDRKFPEAEALFRYAASKDPDGLTVEGRTAQLSLARTLHSEYIGDRNNKGLAQSALDEYKKSLPPSVKDLKDATAAYEKNPNAEDNQRRYYQALSAVDSTTSAIASLYDNLEQPDQAKQWQIDVSNNGDYPPTARARALSWLAAKDNTCANDISDTDQTKKTVTGKDNKQTYQFIKPAKPEDFTTLKQCVDEGNKYIDQALALEPASVNDIAGQDPSKMTDTQIALNGEILRIFDSVRSYKASLLAQAMRIAEMDGRTADKDSLKTQADDAKAKFVTLADAVKKMDLEVQARTQTKEDEANKNANANK